MKILATQPKLVEQVHEAIVSEISAGKLKPGEPIIQEQIAQVLGVSRQPEQQALLLRNQGLLRDAPGRRLIVAPIRAAERNAERAKKQGTALIQNGRKAAAGSSVAATIAADLKLHDFIYVLAENPLIAPTMQSQWTYTQRVMGEVMISRLRSEAAASAVAAEAAATSNSAVGCSATDA